jgi:(S)-ureidoglycine aminohydrolase
MQTEMFITSEADIVSRCRAVIKPGQYAILPHAQRVLSYLPQFNMGVHAKVMAAPNMGARFVEHELLMAPNGATAEPIDEDQEQFLYVLEGGVELELDGKKHKMQQGGFCWLPSRRVFQLANKSDAVCRMLWIRRKFVVIQRLGIPDPIVANERDVKPEPTDTYMEQHLTPYYEDPRFDLGINIQVFDPGVYFTAVESHIMEHGLYMLYGRGIYWLNKDFIEVQKDDFVYMAPFCPQFFYAAGWDKSAYLLYKDVNRDYTVEL